jgi:hypothetical protein
LVYQQNKQTSAIRWNEIAQVWRKVGMLNGMMTTLAYVVQPATAPQFAFSLLTGSFSNMVLGKSSGSTTVSMGAGKFSNSGGFIQISGNFTLTEYVGLGDLIEEHLLEYKLPQALAAYRAGNSVGFGNFVVRQQGLADSTRELAWANIDRIQVTATSIQITKKPASLVWFNLSATDIPNFALLTALLNTIQEGKT